MVETMVGADVAGLRSLAGLFDRSADSLARSMGLLTSSVASAGQWTGPDANRFRSSWASSCRPALTRAIGELHQAATTARTNADEQERVSSGTGGGASGIGMGIGASASGSVGIGGSASFWDRLRGGAVTTARDIKSIYNGYDQASRLWNMSLLADLPEALSAQKYEQALAQLARVGEPVDVALSPFARALGRVSPDLGSWLSARAYERGLGDLTRTADSVFVEEGNLQRAAQLVARPFDGIEGLKDSGVARLASVLPESGALRVGADVLGKAGTGLNYLSLGMDSWQTGTSLGEGHYKDAALHGMDTLADIAIISGPEDPLFYAGVAWQGGRLVAAHTDDIAHAAGWVGDKGGDAAGWVGDKGGDAVGALGGGAKSAAKKLTGWL